jgi:hypothetical protein
MGREGSIGLRTELLHGNNQSCRREKAYLGCRELCEVVTDDLNADPPAHPLVHNFFRFIDQPHVQQQLSCPSNS